MSTATNQVRTWSVALLKADAALAALVSTRVYADQAPQKTALPHVIVEVLPGEEDIIGAAGIRQATVIELEVYGVALVAADSDTIAARIDAVLQPVATTSGAYSIASVRARWIDDPPAIFDGKSIYRAGGVYRLIVS